MSVPPTSTSSTTQLQPPIPVKDASKSVLLAAQAMTLPSVTSTSTSQYSAETLITILERPSTSLSQSVDVVMETPDPEVILPDRLPTVATRPFVRLCDPLAVTLPLHSTPLEPPSSQETPARERNISHQFPASLQAHRFYRHKFHSHNQHLPVYRKLTWITNRNHTFYQKNYIGPHRPLEVYISLMIMLKTFLLFVASDVTFLSALKVKASLLRSLIVLYFMLLLFHGSFTPYQPWGFPHC